MIGMRNSVTTKATEIGVGFNAGVKIVQGDTMEVKISD